MTLVVGLNTGTRIQLLSDTRITHPDVTQVEELPGRLKLVLLGTSLCVGYAGPAAAAIDAIREAHRLRITTCDQLATFLKDVSNSPPFCDFMIAHCAPLRLLTARRGHLEEAPVGYIGDDDAWKAFNERRETGCRHITEDPDATIILPAMDAFESIIDDHEFPTVAGLLMRVGSRAEGFRYLEVGRAFIPDQTIPSDQETVLQFGDAAAGGFSYTVLVPRRRRCRRRSSHVSGQAWGRLRAART